MRGWKRSVSVGFGDRTCEFVALSVKARRRCMQASGTLGWVGRSDFIRELQAILVEEEGYEGHIKWWRKLRRRLSGCRKSKLPFKHDAHTWSQIVRLRASLRVNSTSPLYPPLRNFNITYLNIPQFLVAVRPPLFHI